MAVDTERCIWEELQHLHARVLQLEEKIEEKLGGCEIWRSFKHFVYLALIIIPAFILLLTLGMLVREE
jgi:hypothetical protein